MIYIFFFFKQKTAYEMRISDWSSDVCSSDLLGLEIVEERWLAQARRCGDGLRGGAREAASDEKDGGGIENVAPGVEACLQPVGAGASGIAVRIGGCDMDHSSFLSGDREIGRAPGRERVCKEV